MIRYERLSNIEDFLKNNGSVTVSELSKQMNVSKETIRKDLDYLASQRKIGRVHGGAYSFEYDRAVPFQAREKMLDKPKTEIAKFTSNLIEDGKTLFIDSSTTASTLLRRLILDHKKLTVITNSFEALLLSSNADLITVFTTGGQLNKDYRRFDTTDFSLVNALNADYAIISPSGVDMGTGVTDQDPIESQIRRKFIERASKTILVIDHTKMNNISPFAVSGLDDISGIVTDKISNLDEWQQAEQQFSFFIQTVDGK